MNVSIEFEHYLSYLFGKSNYHGYVGLKSISEWKKVLIKVLKALKKSITVTIESTDSQHKQRMLLLCDETEKRIANLKNIDSVNEQTILGLTSLIFEVLGGRPDNWNRITTNSENHWRLNRKRQISYCQSFSQKANIILDEAYRQSHDNFTEMHKTLYRKFVGNERKFCEWYKETHPNKYLSLFS